MSSIPQVGRQASNLNQLGRTLADATRNNTAPNQTETNLLPPETCPVPKGPGKLRPDGKPQMQNGHRFQGANSIALRMDAAARGTTETRYATEGRAQMNNRAHGVGRQEVVRGVNPVTGQTPTPVVVNSHKAHAVQNVHAKDGKGFGPGGEARGEVDVKAGDPVYEKDGKQARDFHELRATYPVYNVQDLNIAELRPKTEPNSADWSIKEQDAQFKGMCKANGQEERAPTADERVSLVINKEVANLLRDLKSERGVEVKQDVAKIDEARLRVVKGTPTIEIPAAKAFSDVHHQATSITQAASHAQLYTSAKQAADRGVKQGVPNEAAQARVDAYEQPPAKRAASEEYSKAELAATYATVNRVTAMPATYDPPASTRDPVQTERWAAQMEKPGGMAEVSRDIVTVEKGFTDDRSAVQDAARKERAQERQQQTMTDRQDSAREAAPVVRPAVPREGPAQTQTQERETEQPAH